MYPKIWQNTGFNLRSMNKAAIRVPYMRYVAKLD